VFFDIAIGSALDGSPPQTRELVEQINEAMGAVKDDLQ
jgi:hypothetical protein